MKKIRVLELRSVWGTGGGPDKTILAGAALHSDVVEPIVCYVRDARDTAFSIDVRARELGVDYEEIIERGSVDYSIWPALRALVRRRAINIVHAHDYKTDVLALALARSADVIPLSTAHGFVGSGTKERYLYYPLDRRILTWFPRVIAVSSSVRDELLRAGSKANRVTVVLNGINPQAFVRDRARAPEIRRAYGFADDEIVIGAVGRLDFEKRFDLLIRAVAAVRTRWPLVRLAIAGEGKWRPRLEAEIARLGVGSWCRLLGLQRDISTLHHAFDLFVQSSIREGTSNAVLEAMALQTPVVATDAGGTAELVVDGVHGLIVPVGSEASLVDAISRALSDQSATAARARAARTRVETELSFASRMARVDAICQELFEGRTARFLPRKKTADAT
jgi:glycosyltransferase involved in cell wall biosynthesis